MSQQQVSRTDIAGLRFTVPGEDLEPMSPDRFAAIMSSFAGILPVYIPTDMHFTSTNELDRLSDSVLWEAIVYDYKLVRFGSPLEIIAAISLVVGGLTAIRPRHVAHVISALEFLRDYKAQQRSSLAAARTDEDRAALYGAMASEAAKALDSANLDTFQSARSIYLADRPDGLVSGGIVTFEVRPDRPVETVDVPLATDPVFSVIPSDDMASDQPRVLKHRTPASVIRSLQALPDDFQVEPLGSSEEQDPP